MTTTVTRCIVVTKRGRKPHDPKKLRPLVALNEQKFGLLVQSLPGLKDYAPKIEVKPAVAGPSTPEYDEITPIRTRTFRRFHDYPRACTPDWHFLRKSSGTNSTSRLPADAPIMDTCSWVSANSANPQ